MGSRPFRLELGLVALVDEVHAVQFVLLEDRPATARQRRAIIAITTLPREFHHRLSFPTGRSAVDAAPDVAEQKRATPSVIENR
jgi:hypothetical protein